jgi:hypothetical protein
MLAILFAIGSDEEKNVWRGRGDVLEKRSLLILIANGNNSSSVAL